MLQTMVVPRIVSYIRRIVTMGHVISIDIALGVCGCMVLCSQSLATNVPWQWYITVPLATWAVYIIDRLLDIRRTTQEASTYRHGLVRTHQRLLATLAALLIIASGINAIATPNVTRM